MKMRVFFKIVVWVILAIVAVFLGLVLWGVHQMGQDASKRCKVLRSSLFREIDQAKQVRIIEHSNRWDFSPPDDVAHPEKIYATVVLNPSQIVQLKAAMFPTQDHSANTFHSCIFEPHHRIEIVSQNNSVSVVEICFMCGDLDIGEGQRILPDGWDVSLKAFIASLSMRPDGPWRIGETTTDVSK